MAFDTEAVRDAVGCPSCRNTGYRGRLVIAELLVVDDSIADTLIGNGRESTLAAAAMRSGMRPMLADGLEKICAGETTIEEVLRAAQNI